MQTMYLRKKKETEMGLVYADIELINEEDILMSKRHIIGEEEVKRMNVNILVDTGAFMLAINESIQEVLKLPLQGRRRVQVADGRFIECDLVGPVQMRCKNRVATGNALLLEGDSEPLLGVLPLEEMQLLIDPAREELVVYPEFPDFVVYKMK